MNFFSLLTLCCGLAFFLFGMNIMSEGLEKLAGGKLLTGGGRVLGVTETAATLGEAIEKAYKTVKTVNFENAFYRKDIGKKAMEV